jgi:hypothetical protein
MLNKKQNIYCCSTHKPEGAVGILSRTNSGPYQRNERNTSFLCKGNSRSCMFSRSVSVTATLPIHVASAICLGLKSYSFKVRRRLCQNAKARNKCSRNCRKLHEHSKSVDFVKSCSNSVVCGFLLLPTVLE